MPKILRFTILQATTQQNTKQKINNKYNTNTPIWFDTVRKHRDQIHAHDTAKTSLKISIKSRNLSEILKYQ